MSNEKMIASFKKQFEVDIPLFVLMLAMITVIPFFFIFVSFYPECGVNDFKCSSLKYFAVPMGIFSFTCGSDMFMHLIRSRLNREYIKITNDNLYFGTSFLFIEQKFDLAKIIRISRTIRYNSEAIHIFTSEKDEFLYASSFESNSEYERMITTLSKVTGVEVS